jgi:serine/threonine-protein kinase
MREFPKTPDYEARFRDEDVLGRGGAAEVRRVHESTLERSVALKRPHRGLDPVRQAELLDEARLIAELEHPGIVPVYEIGQDPSGNAFFTMKVANGATLRSQLTRPVDGPSTEELCRLVDVLIKVCDTLACAHAKGVVHCDVKPENIVVGDYGEVIVLDWGVARRLQRDTAPPAIYTRRGSPGTPAYMAPEIARGQESDIDPRTDVFLVGGLLFEILLGTPPYYVPNSRESLERAKECNPVASLDDVEPSEQRLAAIARRAMAERREDRYQNMQELKRALQNYLRAGPLLERRSVPADALIIEQGDLGDEVYLIVEGECEAFRRSDGKVLAKMGPGEVFGEVALLAESRRTASVRAVVDTMLVVLRKQDLEDEITEGSWLAVLVKSLARRFAQKDRRVAELEAQLLEPSHDALR